MRDWRSQPFSFAWDRLNHHVVIVIFVLSIHAKVAGIAVRPCHIMPTWTAGPATIRVLPEVVAAVDDRIEVLLDGGVRRGGDVVKAVALGARAVLIGRPYIWALAAGGQSGVTQLLALYRRNIDATLRLLACPSVAAQDPSVLRMPPHGCNCK